MKIGEEHGGMEYTVTGSYEGTEPPEKRFKSIMQQNVVDDGMDIAEDAGE